MARKIGIGHQDFEKVRVNDNFYIDKTDFIREWWETNDEVTLIARPRRFGKTLTISMLEKFFSINYAGRGELFEGLSVWQEEEYRNLQGTYPVISLSFANVKEKDYVMTVQRISQIVTELYNDNRFLMEGDLFSEEEKTYYRSVCMDMPEVSVTMAIHRMSKFLSQYYGKKVIILLDEYDTPMQEAYIHGFWDELVSFIRSMFNAAFKTNPYLERAIMTGVTRVSKESIFSDLNHLEVVTTTSEKYAECFGFTEQEVFSALDEYGLSDRKAEVKRWYDGFAFGNRTDIYNPWSIINYLDKKKLGAYWANTSSNSLIGKLLREGGKSTKQDFEKLLQGGCLQMEIDEQIVYNQLSDNENAVWSLLLASGYLRVSGVEYVEHTGGWDYRLVLTNREVKVMFENMVRGWFGRYKEEYNDFIKGLLKNDIKAMNYFMNKVALATFSYFDYCNQSAEQIDCLLARHSQSEFSCGRYPLGKKPSEEEPERFYHGFVLGMMVDLNDRYILTSNRESGFGRYDVVLEPRQAEDHAIILEFKVQDRDEERDLQDTVKAALQQIETMKYETCLVEKGMPKEKIHKYGFAFCGKTVLIDGC